MNTIYAYKFINDENKPALMVSDGADVWEEPIDGWTLVLDLRTGRSYWEHKNGQRFEDVPPSQAEF